MDKLYPDDKNKMEILLEERESFDKYIKSPAYNNLYCKYITSTQMLSKARKLSVQNKCENNPEVISKMKEYEKRCDANFNEVNNLLKTKLPTFKVLNEFITSKYYNCLPNNYIQITSNDHDEYGVNNDNSNNTDDTDTTDSGDSSDSDSGDSYTSDSDVNNSDDDNSDDDNSDDGNSDDDNSDDDDSNDDNSDDDDSDN
jgi:hypothetical protein